MAASSTITSYLDLSYIPTGLTTVSSTRKSPAYSLVNQSSPGNATSSAHPPSPTSETLDTSRLGNSIVIIIAISSIIIAISLYQITRILIRWRRAQPPIPTMRPPARPPAQRDYVQPDIDLHDLEPSPPSYDSVWSEHSDPRTDERTVEKQPKKISGRKRRQDRPQDSRVGLLAGRTAAVIEDQRARETRH